MALRDNELARREDGRLELRPRPLRVRWSLGDLETADGHDLRATFTCSARALPDATERRMLDEVLLGSQYAVNDQDLAKHFEPALHAAAAKAAQKHPAPQWLDDGTMAGELTESLRKAAATVAFDCGVELMPPFNLELESPSYQQALARARQQALAEKQTAEQVGHVQRAAGLLKEFQAIRDAAPELSPGRVLERVSPADRGAVLQTLLLASAGEGRAEQPWAVAGPYLVRVSIGPEARAPELFPLPPAAGPLRSVQPARVHGRRKLLVGARGGFLLVDAENPAEAQVFADQFRESSLGFNRVVYWGERQGYAATHGDAGVVCWRPDANDSPAAALRPEQLGLRASAAGSSGGTTSFEGAQSPGPRNLQVLDDDTLIFSAGGKVFTTDLREASPLEGHSTSDVVAILPEERRMVIVHEDGTICTVDRASRQVECVLRRSTRVRSAGALPWLGSNRILLAADPGAVECVGLDDPVVTQYQSRHPGLRAVAGSADAVAGISSDRQRLLLWHSWDGRQPVSEIYLTGLTRHRVADVDFG